MSKIREFTQQLSTWEFYPRVYYFSNRLNNFVPRFKKIAVNFPEDMNDLIQDLEGLQLLFSYAPEVKVIDESDLLRKDLVAENVAEERLKQMAKQMPKMQGGSGTTISICHARVKALDSNSVQILKHRVDFFDKTFHPGRKKNEYLLVVCQPAEAFSDEQKVKFEDDMKSRLDKFCKGHSIEYSIVVCKETSVSKIISDMFELKIIGGFRRVISFVNRYMKASNQRILRSESLLENYYVDEQLTHLLHTANYLNKEIQPKDAKTHIRSDDNPFVDILLKKVAISLKCAINKPLADRCNLQLQACNTKLISMKFEAEVMKSVSSGVRANMLLLSVEERAKCDVPKSSKRNRRLQRQWEEKENKENETRAESKKVLSSLKNDLKEVVSQAERDVGIFARLLQKLLFEINNYVKKSCVSEEQKRCTIAEVSRDLRKQILQLKGVYGAGTIYGEFEIIVDSEENANGVRKEVVQILRERNVEMSFSVKTIKSNPKLYSDIQYEEGDPISCENDDKCGTLGGFVLGSDNKCYGLTCAHVVTPVNEEKDVFIKKDKPIKFAKCFPDLTVQIGTGTKPLIDIAAIEVYDDHHQKCVKLLKDENGIFRKATLVEEVNGDVELAGNPVYKHGAESDLTVGIVSSDDFSLLFENDELEYILLIDIPVGSESPFAMPGDSGAMTCMSNENTAAEIKAVGLLSGGDLNTLEDEDTPYCMCYLLKHGLTKLSANQRGLRFRFHCE